MYTGRTFNREQVYICGDYMDGDIYPVFQAPGCRRKRCKPTKEIQARLNQKNAERKLTRLIHNNFTEKDYAVHVTYRPGEEPKDEADAQRILANFLRRLKRTYKKAGAELKYISCTEFGSRGGRVHHHIILNSGISRDEIEALWGKGYANSKRLQFEADGLAGLAKYITKERRTYKRWNQSRSLIIPEPAQYDGRLNMHDMEEIEEAIERKAATDYFERMYPDYELVNVYCMRNNVNRGLYVHYEMRRRR